VIDRGGKRRKRGTRLHDHLCWVSGWEFGGWDHALGGGAISVGVIHAAGGSGCSDRGRERGVGGDGQGAAIPWRGSRNWV